jgi:hypothetical protein
VESTVVDKVIEQLRTLPEDMQARVLEYARTLATSGPHGASGGSLLQFAGSIAADDLKLMAETIEAGCEQIDDDES